MIRRLPVVLNAQDKKSCTACEFLRKRDGSHSPVRSLCSSNIDKPVWPSGPLPSPPPFVLGAEMCLGSLSNATASTIRTNRISAGGSETSVAVKTLYTLALGSFLGGRPWVGEQKSKLTLIEGGRGGVHYKSLQKNSYVFQIRIGPEAGGIAPLSPSYAHLWERPALGLKTHSGEWTSQGRQALEKISQGLGEKTVLLQKGKNREKA